MRARRFSPEPAAVAVGLHRWAGGGRGVGKPPGGLWLCGRCSRQDMGGASHGGAGMTRVGCSRSATVVGHQEACARAGGRAGLRRRGAALGVHWKRLRWAEERGGQGGSSRTLGNVWPLRVARRVPGCGFLIHAPAARRPVGRQAGRAGGGAVARPRWQSRAALPPLPPPRPPTAPAHPRAERYAPRLQGAPAASPERGRTAGSSLEPRVPQGWGLA